MIGQTEGGQILEKLGDDVPSAGWGVASVEGYARGAQGPVNAVIASHSNLEGVFWEGEFPEMMLNNRNVSSISLHVLPNKYRLNPGTDFYTDPTVLHFTYGLPSTPITPARNPRLIIPWTNVVKTALQTCDGNPPYPWYLLYPWY